MRKFYFPCMFLIIIATFVLFLSGCGSSSPVTSNGAITTQPASAYVKLTNGNKWVWNINQITTSSTTALGVVSTPTTYSNASQTTQYGVTTASGTSATSKTIIPNAGIAIYSYNIGLNTSGDLMITDASGTPYIYLPANLPVGMSWPVQGLFDMGGGSMASGTVQYTVVGVNIAKSVPGFATPFNDVLQLNVFANNITAVTIIPGMGTMTGPVNISGSYFISKQAGNVVYSNIITTMNTGTYSIPGVGTVVASTTVTINSTQILQPGYIAN